MFKCTDIVVQGVVTVDDVKDLLRGSGIELIAFQTGTRPELNFENKYLEYVFFDIFYGYDTLFRKFLRSKLTVDDMFLHYQFSYWWVSPLFKFLPYQM